MRLLMAGVALLVSTTAAAQSRWTLSAGPEWAGNRFPDVFGARARAEYDLVRPDKPLRLRLELSGFWEPTQNYFGTYTLLDNGMVAGSNQLIDVSFGMTAALTPLPRARFAPYATIGFLAQQGWNNGWRSVSSPQGSTYQTFSVTGGQMIFPVGLGIRARLADHMFQVELRRSDNRNALLVGTSLPF